MKITDKCLCLQISYLNSQSLVILCGKLMSSFATGIIIYLHRIKYLFQFCIDISLFSIYYEK